MPTTISTRMFTTSWMAEPRTSDQLVNAVETAMSAAAGIVVTEMNTPSRALLRASVSDTIPTIPARVATATEKKFGVLMRLETGRNPRSKASDCSPKPRMTRAKRNVTTMVRRKPVPRAASPPRTMSRWPRSIPSATLTMAPYSGPTTIAATIRICELVTMPTEPISPATTR